jgi:uncharacterized protein YhdP
LLSTPLSLALLTGDFDFDSDSFDSDDFRPGGRGGEARTGDATDEETSPTP